MRSIEKQEFPSGAFRDSDHDKLRFELIPPSALVRIAKRFTDGAKHYGDDNFRKGIPFRRCFGSMLRHAFAWAAGKKDEDHLAAVVFNAIALMFFENEIAANRLPSDLADMPDWHC